MQNLKIKMENDNSKIKNISEMILHFNSPF